MFGAIDHATPEIGRENPARGIKLGLAYSRAKSI
jgi:hypothetical protein